MEYSLELADTEATTEFGSLHLKDADGVVITLLTPLWLEDDALSRLSAIQGQLNEIQNLPEHEQFARVGDLKAGVIDLLCECADKSDRLRAQLAVKPLPVVMTVLRRWEKAAQPGEA